MSAFGPGTSAVVTLFAGDRRVSAFLATLNADNLFHRLQQAKDAAEKKDKSG